MTQHEHNAIVQSIQYFKSLGLSPLISDLELEQYDREIVVTFPEQYWGLQNDEARFVYTF